MQKHLRALCKSCSSLTHTQQYIMHWNNGDFFICCDGFNKTALQFCRMVCVAFESRNEEQRTHKKDVASIKQKHFILYTCIETSETTNTHAHTQDTRKKKTWTTTATMKLKTQHEPWHDCNSVLKSRRQVANKICL